MMQAFSVLVTLAPVHDFIIMKQTLALDMTHLHIVLHDHTGLNVV
jgi:hypothetical protein